MKEHDPSSRDELVAAYLDGEATPAERAQVEADPELMERVALLGEVAQMVGAPITPPPLEVRRAHISAALAASETAPNVTSLATRRSRWSGNFAAVASAAAIIAIALLAVPLLLINAGGDDDDTAASIDFDEATESDGALSTTEADAAEPAEQPAEEPAFDAADAPATSELSEAADDSATSESELAAEAPAEEAAAEAAEEPAEEPADAGGALELFDADVAALITGDLADLGALRDRAQLQLANPQTARTATEIGLTLGCADALGEFVGADQEVLVGAGLVAGEPVEYVVAEGPAGERTLVVVDASSCSTLDVVDLMP